MINILCEPEYWDKVQEFAAKMGLSKQLNGRLYYLANYGNNGDDYDGNTICLLGKDFAPYSFSFMMKRRKSTNEPYQNYFNGGLIYQGPNCPADGSFPSLTVSLAEGTGWFVHT